MTEASGGQSRLRDWPRGATLVSVLGVLLVGAGVYATQSPSPTGRSPNAGGANGTATPELLTTELRRVFAGDECPSASHASRAVQRVLTDLGYSDWSIKSATGVTPDDCVTGTIAVETHEVVLLPALTAAERSALHQVQDNTYDRCLSERQVSDMLIAALAQLGQTDFTIESDGPLMAPTDRFEEVEKHVLAGCWVYSGTGLSEDGNRFFLLVGPPPT